MDKFIEIEWHHGGRFVYTPTPEYVDELAVSCTRIDTDFLSIPELASTIKDLGYDAYDGIFYKAKDDEAYVAMDDWSLTRLAAKLKNGDKVNFYVNHPIMQPQFSNSEPKPLPTNMERGVEDAIPIIDDGEPLENARVDIQPMLLLEHAPVQQTEIEEVEAQQEQEEVEGETVAEEEVAQQEEVEEVAQQEEIEEVAQQEDVEEVESEEEEDVSSADEDYRGDDASSSSTDDTISRGVELSDDSDIDEELREIRNRARETRARRAKHRENLVNVEVTLGGVGPDEGFENWSATKDYSGVLGGNEPYYASESDYSLESDSSEDDDSKQKELRRKKSSHVMYNPECECPNWELDMVFEGVQQFRDALAKYAIAKGVRLKLRPNEAHRVTAKCTHEGCPWRIHASVHSGTQNFQVKTYTPKHSCRRYNKNKLCTSKFLAKLLESRIVSQPSLKIWEIQAHCRKELKLYVGKTICRRAKVQILRKHMGDYKEEWSRLHDYVDEVNRSNPGSTCFLVVDSQFEPGKELFKRLYVCFKALKEGWKQGCRRIIGVDAYFLKGAVGGQSFVAVGKDGNGQMYPIAWEVTGSESTITWSKFIRTLQLDLDLGKGEGLTIVSDMQLGLRAAVRKELPEAEHIFCAQHIYANWQKKWRGSERRKKFWACCWSTFDVQLKDNLQVLGRLGPELVADFLEYGKENLCKPYFRTDSKCDVVENNMCETFNSWIRAARHKSIISMLEDIRRQVMERIRKMNDFVPEKWITDIAPTALMRLDRNKDLAMQCDLSWNGDQGFEVLHGEYGHTVDLRLEKCSCNSWQLKGIPCPHAICAMNHVKVNPDDHVVHWYKKETYLKAYALPLQPVLGMKMWPISDHPPVEHPKIRKKRGRKKVNRRKARDEPRKAGRYSRNGIVMSCSICKAQGHNKKGCPNKSNPETTTTQTRASSSRAPSQAAPQAQGAITRASSRAPSQPAPQAQGATTRASSRSRARAAPTPSDPLVPSASSRGRTRTRDQERAQSEGGIGGRPQKRGRLVGRGIYTNPTTGVTLLNPGLESGRVLRAPKPTKHSSQGADFSGLGKGLKWQGRAAITSNQLQKTRAQAAKSLQAPFGSQSSSNQP